MSHIIGRGRYARSTYPQSPSIGLGVSGPSGPVFQLGGPTGPTGNTGPTGPGALIQVFSNPAPTEASFGTSFSSPFVNPIAFSAPVGSKIIVNFTTAIESATATGVVTGAVFIDGFQMNALTINLDSLAAQPLNFAMTFGEVIPTPGTSHTVDVKLNIAAGTAFPQNATMTVIVAAPPA